MAEKNNAVCDICGKGYYVCLSCSDAMKLHPYKSFTDTAEHFKIFQVVKGFLTGVYSKDEAREKFKSIDLGDIESFRPHIKDIIKDVLKEEKTDVEAVETVVETEIAEVEITTSIEDVEKIENVVNTTYSHKKNYKKWK